MRGNNFITLDGDLVDLIGAPRALQTPLGQVLELEAWLETSPGPGGRHRCRFSGGCARRVLAFARFAGERPYVTVTGALYSAGEDPSVVLVNAITFHCDRGVIQRATAWLEANADQP